MQLLNSENGMLYFTGLEIVVLELCDSFSICRSFYFNSKNRKNGEDI